LAPPSNDAAEGEALRRLFGAELPPLSSLKPQLGYTLGANALLELVAWLWCVEAGFVPATPNFRQLDPEAGVAPLAAPLPVGGGRFLLNCFGFGGNNTCLVLAHD
jgi:3-oxoacyl-[acyl-carrier-protein] synthase-1